jgi:membrane-associated phospholipid phosphatase
MDINTAITKSIYNNIGDNKNSIIRHMPVYLGLIPYKIFVYPGMFIGIIDMMWSKNQNSLQIHLIPHWFAFAILTYMNNNIRRMKPGCALNDIRIRDSISHCNKSCYKSFPSGHTGISFALATSITLFLTSKRNKENGFGKFWGLIDYDNKNIRLATIILLYMVAIMMSIHKISYGYNYLSDILIGAIIGMIISFVCFHIIEMGKCSYTLEKKEEEENKDRDLLWLIIKWIITIFCVLAIIHFVIFKLPKLFKLSKLTDIYERIEMQKMQRMRKMKKMRKMQKMKKMQKNAKKKD